MVEFDANQPKIQYNSREWTIVEEWLQGDLEAVYVKLASPYTNPEQTQQLRGRASLLRQMLDWKKDSAGLTART